MICTRENLLEIYGDYILSKNYVQHCLSIVVNHSGITLLHNSQTDLSSKQCIHMALMLNLCVKQSEVPGNMLIVRRNRWVTMIDEKKKI